MAAGVDLAGGHMLGLVRHGVAGFARSSQRFRHADAESLVRLAGVGHRNQGQGEQCGPKGKESDTAAFRRRKSHVRLKARHRRGGIGIELEAGVGRMRGFTYH